MRIGWILLSVAVVTGGLVACSSDSDDAGAAVGAGGTGFGGSSAAGGFGNANAAGSAGYGGGGGFSGGAGSAGNGSGGSGGNQNEGGADAGADAAPDAEPDAGACDGMDPSKDAVFYLSNDDSNSMASPAIARSWLQKGMQVPTYVLRTYEFLNYYNIGFTPAPAGSVSIVPELAPGSTPGAYELSIGVVAPAATNPRRPMNLTFVLDTSGSMSGSPIARERDVVLALASELKSGDRVSIVTWNTSNAVLLDSYAVSGPNDAKLVAIANGIAAGGGTDLNGGLTAGYALANKNFDANELNRVILISDGQANAGITDENIIAKGAALNDGDGIYLVGVGVGDGVNDTLMDAVTDAGRGAYVYVDTKLEAQRMFSNRFDEVMDVAARAVQVELRMPWYMNIEVFHGEEYSTNPQEVEPQHLAPNDAMVFHQIVRACSESELSVSDPLEVVARWKTPMGHEDKQASVATTFEALLGGSSEHLTKSAAIIAYAEALKQPDKERLQKAKQVVQAAAAGKNDPELNEILGLLDLALVIY